MGCGCKQKPEPTPLPKSDYDFEVQVISISQPVIDELPIPQTPDDLLNQQLNSFKIIRSPINYKFSKREEALVEKLKKKNSAVEVAFEVVLDSIDWIFDGEQYYYAKETTKEELMAFIESLNQDQFSKLEEFFEHLPKMNRKVEMKCSKCGFDHTIEMEGLESFFG